MTLSFCATAPLQAIAIFPLHSRCSLLTSRSPCTSSPAHWKAVILLHSPAQNSSLTPISHRVKAKVHARPHLLSVSWFTPLAPLWAPCRSTTDTTCFHLRAFALALLSACGCPPKDKSTICALTSFRSLLYCSLFQKAFLDTFNDWQPSHSSLFLELPNSCALLQFSS